MIIEFNYGDSPKQLYTNKKLKYFKLSRQLKTEQ